MALCLLFLPPSAKVFVHLLTPINPAVDRELLAPLFHVAKKKSGQDIMLGGQKVLKNLGESISDTQITVSWSVWKRNQKNRYFGQKMAVFDILYGQDIMLGGQKISKNLGESISDTQINVSWSVWKRTQKNHLKPPKIALFGPKFMYFTGLMSMSRVKNARQSLGNSTLVLLML